MAFAQGNSGRLNYINSWNLVKNGTPKTDDISINTINLAA